MQTPQREESRPRATTRSPREVQGRLDTLDPSAAAEERAMLLWMLRQGEYPTWGHEVRRVVDAAVHVEGNVRLNAESVRLQGGAPTHDDGDIVEDILALLSTGAAERSVDALRKMSMPPAFTPVPTLDQMRASFRQNLFFMSDEDSFNIHQAILTGRPLLLGGPAGTGKSECARQIALALGLDDANENHFGTLFCTPEVGVRESVYEWNDARRLLDLQLVNNLLSSMGARLTGDSVRRAYQSISAEAFGLRYLEIKRLLRHCLIPFRTVCLIDEVDKTFSEFDNILLDLLSRFRFHIPEYAGGAIGRPYRLDPFGADTPLFVLTSNESRELSAPLASRCVQVWLKYLPEKLEAQVIAARGKLEASEAGRVAQFFRKIRTDTTLRLRHPPSTREVLATASALRLAQMAPTDTHLLMLHCHWVKNKLDFDTIHKKFHTATGWAPQI